MTVYMAVISPPAEVSEILSDFVRNELRANNKPALNDKIEFKWYVEISQFYLVSLWFTRIHLICFNLWS